MMLGNTKLVEYGIFQDESDYRVHVCPSSHHVYVYETNLCKTLLNKKEYRTAPAYQHGIKTAIGFLVPPFDIPGCYSVAVPNNWWTRFNETSTTTEKGELAAKMVKVMIERGMIKLKLVSKIENNLELQIIGVDIVVCANLRIQTKCDFKGGEKSFGGTGNLYIQTHECNPFKMQ